MSLYYFVRGIWKLNGIPVPKTIFCDFSKEIVDRDYTIIEFKNGYNWHYIQNKITKAQNSDLFAQLGALTKKIHSIENPKNKFGFPYPFKMHRKWSSFIQKLMKMIVSDMKKYSPYVLEDDLSPDKIVKRMTNILDEVTVSHLNHGDLWQRNVLVKKQGNKYKINALIDFERGVWGDPCFEWVFHCWDIAPSFWRTYNQNKEDKNHKVRCLLYKGYHILVASLEELHHFNKKKKSLLIFHQAKDVFNELSALLR